MRDPYLTCSFPRPSLQPVEVSLNPDPVLHCKRSPLQLSASKLNKHNVYSIFQYVVKKIDRSWLRIRHAEQFWKNEGR